MRNMTLYLAAVLLFGSCGDQDELGIPPEAFELKQNAPNPFTDTTLIQYGIPTTAKVPPHIRVVVFNRLNDRIATLRDSSSHPAGMFNLTWQPGATQPAGIYYIELQTIDRFESASAMKRIAILKQ
ncbi:MAG: hypothetical protein HUU02_10270 [Bacteroidetes bacterium]|nr:hypothetical protein [Bacteroidota bacterium]